jgi:hypothetical protein
MHRTAVGGSLNREALIIFRVQKEQFGATGRFTHQRDRPARKQSQQFLIVNLLEQPLPGLRVNHGKMGVR